MITGKIWGSSQCIFQSPIVELHRICTKAGYRCSKHKHEHKSNLFFVESGLLEIHVFKNSYDLKDVTELRSGDTTIVRPGEFHYFLSVEDSIGYELYFPELLSEDIIREDVGKMIVEGFDEQLAQKID